MILTQLLEKMQGIVNIVCKSYQTDFSKHDTNALERLHKQFPEGVMFFWLPYEMGTHFVAIHENFSNEELKANFDMIDYLLDNHVSDQEANKFRYYINSISDKEFTFKEVSRDYMGVVKNMHKNLYKERLKGVTYRILG
jgi:hypothetical protein